MSEYTIRVIIAPFKIWTVLRKNLFLNNECTSWHKIFPYNFRGSLRAMMTLLPLLGLTWLLSLLVPFSVVFHYFFVIINTLQVRILFFRYCLKL